MHAKVGSWATADPAADPTADHAAAPVQSTCDSNAGNAVAVYVLFCCVNALGLVRLHWLHIGCAQATTAILSPALDHHSVGYAVPVIPHLSCSLPSDQPEGQGIS